MAIAPAPEVQLTWILASRASTHQALGAEFLRFLKNLISDQSYGCLKMDWQKVSLKPQFWYKCDGYLLWTVITWTPEVQLTWILFLWQGRFQALVMGTEFKVLTWKDSSEPLFEKLRQYFGFHCFCFPCQDFGRFLLNTSLLHLKFFWNLFLFCI